MRTPVAGTAVPAAAPAACGCRPPFGPHPALHRCGPRNNRKPGPQRPSAFPPFLADVDQAINFPSASAISTEVQNGVPIGSDSTLSDFPWLVPLGAALVAVPLALALRRGGQSVKAVPAAAALETLQADPAAVLVDIRSKDSVKQNGTPNLASLKKKLLSVAYTKTVSGEDLIDDGFAERLAKLSAVKPLNGGVIILLDSYGQEAPAAARAVAAVVGQGTSVQYVKDGADGAKGWKASELPWTEPVRLPSLNLAGLKGLGGGLDSLADDLKVPQGGKPQADFAPLKVDQAKAGSDVGKVGLALGAVAAVSLVVFQGIETVLEVVGLIAAAQFFAKRLIFAKDRARTASELKDLVDNKIAPGEAGEDLRRIATSLLEVEEAAPLTREIETAAKDAKAQLNENGLGELPTKKVKVVEPSPAVATGAEPTPGQPANNPQTPAASEARGWIENWKERST